MLHVHRSDRADGLIEALRALLARAAGRSVRARAGRVPTRGMERWLTQRLSVGLGICANVEFPFPRRLTGDAVAAASGIDPDDRPVAAGAARVAAAGRRRGGAAGSRGWELRRTWRSTDAPVRGRPPSRHAVRPLRAAPARGATGRRPLAGASCGGGCASGSRSRTRRRGWRRVRAAAGEPGAVELPSASRCSASRGCPPPSCTSCARWPSTATCTCSCCIRRRRCGSGSRRGAARRAPRRGPDAHAGRATACSPPGGRTRASCSSSSAPDVVTHEHPVEHRAGTLLARLQAAVREDAPPEPGAADGSIEVHACHGRARQVEVLRDAILHLLEEDPTLEPRDVIVMCPDIETFAPLIQATFGAEEDEERARRPPARPARAARGPLAAPDQPGARRGRAAARAARAAADGVAGARPRRPRAGAAALPARRRRARAARGLGVRERHPLGPGRRAPRAVQALRRCPRGRGAPGWTGCWSA